jgi:phage/plasmid-like protein (TIGR03299 family)
MPHNLFQGRMAWVNEVPWHGLGTRVSSCIVASEMIKAANLAWGVTVCPAPGARLVSSRRDTYDRYLIERDPVGQEKEKAVLGLVGSRYVPLQNAEAFSFFEPFIRNGWASFHTAGALGNGERVWVQAQLSGQIIVVPGDAIDKFLLLSNSHDGSGAVTIRFTPIRVVCQNTLNYAMEGGSAVISVRHTKNIADNLDKAQVEELKRLVDKVFSEAKMLFGRMAALSLGADETDHFLELLFPRSESQRKAKKEPERWDRIKAVLDDEDFTPPQTRSTLWALYNAIVRDEDYRSSRETGQTARLERVWFGSGHDLKMKALNFARNELQRAG